MRILLMGDYPPPYGGIAIHVQQLHAFLRQAGLDTFVVDVGKEARLAPDILPMRRPLKVLKRCLHGDGRTTVVHVHTSGNNPKAWLLAGAAGALARASGARRVITLHSGLLPAYLAGSRSRRRAARVALASFDVIVAVSAALAAALVEAGVAREKIRCYPAFCASEVNPGPPPEELAEVFGRRSPLLAMAHHPSPVYGRRLMFQALARLRGRHPRIGLALFGPGSGVGGRVGQVSRGPSTGSGETAPTGQVFQGEKPQDRVLQGEKPQDQGGQVPEWLEEARALGVADLIEGFGPLDHASALGLLTCVDAFVRPTTADGDAISVREALTLGIPCVASDVSARPRGTHLFKTGDADALADAIERALTEGPLPTDRVDAGPFLLALYRGLGPPLPARSPEGLSNLT